MALQNPPANEVEFAISTGTAPLFLGVPGTATIEVHVPVGRESRGPIGTANVSPTQAGTNSSGTPIVAIAKDVVTSVPALVVKIANPA